MYLVLLIGVLLCNQASASTVTLVAPSPLVNTTNGWRAYFARWYNHATSMWHIWWSRRTPAAATPSPTTVADPPLRGVSASTPPARLQTTVETRAARKPAPIAGGAGATATGTTSTFARRREEMEQKREALRRNNEAKKAAMARNLELLERAKTDPKLAAQLLPVVEARLAKVAEIRARHRDGR